MKQAIRDVHGDHPFLQRVFEIYPPPNTKLFSLLKMGFQRAYGWDEETRPGCCLQVLQADPRQYRRSCTSWADVGMARSPVLMLDPKAYHVPLGNRANVITIPPSVLRKEFGSNQIFEGQLAVPLAQNFATIDSLLCLHDTSLDGFQSSQITSTCDHGISIKGLADLQKALKPQVPELQALRPSMLQKCIIVFVVPTPMGVSFVKQKFKDPEGKDYWASKTAQ